MIAKDKYGKEIYQNEKIYMPSPARLGRTDQMGRGPYEKSGMIRDTALPPLRTVHERFEIIFPYKDDGKDRHILSNILDVEVRLLYLPFGERNDDHFVWDIRREYVNIEN